jgi:hypothetical protein
MNDSLESIDKSDKKREQDKEMRLKILPLYLLKKQKKKQNTMKKEMVGQQIK